LAFLKTIKSSRLLKNPAMSFWKHFFGMPQKIGGVTTGVFSRLLAISVLAGSSWKSG
jgi:hypothetical protein